MMRLLVGLVLTAFCLVSLLPATRAEARGTMDCFECHERAAFEKAVPHAPAVPGKCGVCHSPHAARHAGLLQEEVKRLCYSCHEKAAASHEQGTSHQPVRAGECLACHAPHSSEYASLVKEPEPALCFECHAGLPEKFPYTHSPYAEGECSACHRSHQSTHENLLVEGPETLCYECHDREETAGAHPGFPARLGKCGSCHSPHGSDRPGLIRNALHEPYSEGCDSCHAPEGARVAVDTCLGCHEEVGEQMASSHNHLVRYENNGCAACHSPHAADTENLLRGNERQVCGRCHEGTFRKRQGAKFSHKSTDACTDCHAPHGSNHPTMLKAPIITVCVQCHTKHEEFTHPIGKSVFDPRTGQVMTCSSCHATKGSGFEKHLRFSGKKDLCVQCHRDY